MNRFNIGDEVASCYWGNDVGYQQPMTIVKFGLITNFDWNNKTWMYAVDQDKFDSYSGFNYREEELVLYSEWVKCVVPEADKTWGLRKSSRNPVKKPMRKKY